MMQRMLGEKYRQIFRSADHMFPGANEKTTRFQDPRDLGAHSFQAACMMHHLAAEYQIILVFPSRNVFDKGIHRPDGQIGLLC